MWFLYFKKPVIYFLHMEPIEHSTPDTIASEDVQTTNLSALSKDELQVLLDAAKEGIGGNVAEIEAAIAQKQSEAL